MANLIKSETGLLFYDDFSEKTLMWSLSPSEVSKAITFGDNGLQIHHTDQYVIYTIVEPKADEYSCIVDLDHVPFNFDDIAGIIVLSSNKEYAECQSFKALTSSAIGNSSHYYEDVKSIIYEEINNNNYVQYAVDNGEPDSSESFSTDTTEDVAESDTSSDSEDKPETTEFVDTLYRFIKFIKLKYKYMFYASTDGYKWIEIGNVSFDDSGVIGFFLYGTDNKEMIANSHFFVHNISIYKSKYITIHGIGRDMDMEMVDGNNVVLFRTDSLDSLYLISRVMKTCLINTTSFPMPIKNAKLKVYPRGEYDSVIKVYELGDLYGGDEFTLEYDIRLFINDKEVNPNKLYDLGTFYHGSYYIKIDIHNFDEYPIIDLKFKVIKYSEYYGGEQEVNIALYDEHRIESDLSYQKEIVIDEIKPSEGRSIFVKLLDKPIQDYYMTANDCRFKIVMDLG